MQVLDSKKISQETIISLSKKVLLDGGLIIYPTETTYGAGVLATSQDAVNKLLAYKSRREGKPLSIAVYNQKMAEKFVKLNTQAQKIYQQFLPGPVTVISKDLGKLAQGVASEFGSLGIRIPDYPLILNLVKTLNQPITATSANASGKKRPYSIQDLLAGLSDKQKSLIDLIIDAGTLPPNPPSIVIDTTLSTPVVMRNNQTQAQKIFRQKNTQVLTLLSQGEKETQDIAGKLLLKNWESLKATGLVIALSGPLGAGKTIFVKGLAKFLNIQTTITSPTYTYLEEYSFKRHQVAGKLHHADVWKMDGQASAEKLQLEKLLGANQLLVIEWFEQIAEYFLLVINKKQTPLIRVELQDLGKQKRKITVE